MKEEDINQQVAERICNSLKWNGKNLRSGECVALLDGEVVAVTRDLDTALRALRAIDADPSRGMVVEVGPSAMDVIR